MQDKFSIWMVLVEDEEGQHLATLSREDGSELPLFFNGPLDEEHLDELREMVEDFKRIYPESFFRLYRFENPAVVEDYHLPRKLI